MKSTPSVKGNADSPTDDNYQLSATLLLTNISLTSQTIRLHTSFATSTSLTSCHFRSDTLTPYSVLTLALDLRRSGHNSKLNCTFLNSSHPL